MHGGKPGDRRAGVVWHTQGSGKSFSMLFYAARIIRHPAMQNPTLVVLTDRNDLDDQLFGQFQRCHELLRQMPVQAGDREHLRQLLQVASGGVVFTTIQKFMPEKGEKMPELSARRNIVVIADEAHRSQYDLIDGLARNLRDALPDASFIGFTGTPIEKNDANTRAIFGDYMSIYDIQRAVADGATVPIYYESRISKLALNQAALPQIDDEFEEITEGEEDDRKQKLKTKWAALEALVGRSQADRARRRRSRGALRAPTGSHGRQGHGRLHEPPHLRGALRRHHRVAARLGERQGRQRGGGKQADLRGQDRHDRQRRGRPQVAAAHPQQDAPPGTGDAIQRPERPFSHRHRAGYVADGL